MPELISETRPVARVDHYCLVCGCIAVRAGEQYLRRVYAFDGSAYAWISCAECDAIYSLVASWAYDDGEGIGSDKYHEWAYEYAWDSDHGEAARAFLRRSDSEIPEGPDHAQPLGRESER
ncbi:hypothetical protein [Gryllotalpicola koreensis]|uniref:Uncharacterized protein n=1 Tax=Gryllotalpicola koreensis TaxID=993086 RepID=A0ABP7ZVB7_9MICO